MVVFSETKVILNATSNREQEREIVPEVISYWYVYLFQYANCDDQRKLSG